MPTYNILSIDGGGLRGIIPIRILQEVERRTGERIQDTFDMFAGTSTGGLIACCLSLRDEADPSKPKYTLAEIESIYTNYGKKIFPVRSAIGKLFQKVANLFSPAYSAKGLDEVLRDYIKEERIKDSFRPLLVSTYDLNSNQPIFFKSADAAENANANAKVYDVCRATSAAPTYLPAYSFMYKDKKLTGIDGGVFINNPSMAVIAEIKRWGEQGYYKKKDGSAVKMEDIRLLSLGTGTYEYPISEEEAVSWGQLQWINQITEIMMKGVNKTTDYEVNQMTIQGNYLRLNVAITNAEYADMADARDITREYLVHETLSQLINNEKVAQTLQDLLDRMS